MGRKCDRNDVDNEITHKVLGKTLTVYKESPGGLHAVLGETFIHIGFGCGMWVRRGRSRCQQLPASCSALTSDILLLEIVPVTASYYSTCVRSV